MIKFYLTFPYRFPIIKISKIYNHTRVYALIEYLEKFETFSTQKYSTQEDDVNAKELMIPCNTSTQNKSWKVHSTKSTPRKNLSSWAETCLGNIRGADFSPNVSPNASRRFAIHRVTRQLPPGDLSLSICKIVFRQHSRFISNNTTVSLGAESTNRRFTIRYSNIEIKMKSSRNNSANHGSRNAWSAEEIEFRVGKWYTKIQKERQTCKNAETRELDF